MSNVHRTLGVIGGSGLYELERLTDVEELETTTPFGDPSDAIVAGTIGHTRLLFLPRHGRGHREGGVGQLGLSGQPRFGQVRHTDDRHPP